MRFLRKAKPPVSKSQLDPETQRIADIVDGEYSEDGVDKYTYVFTKPAPESSDTHLTAIIDSASGGLYLNKANPTMGKFQQALETWRKLFTLENLTPPQLIDDPVELAKYPHFTDNVNEIRELRKQLFLPE